MDPTLSICLSLALALVLGRACLHKAGDPSHFQNSLAAYQVLPENVHRFAAKSLIVLEALVTLALIGQIFFDALPPVGSAGAVFLLTIYSGAIGLNLARDRRDLDCGCEGPGKSRPISPMLLVRNAALMAMGALGAIPLGPRPLLSIDVFSIVFALAVFGLLYEAVSQLGQTARSPFSSPASQARRVS